MKKLSRFAVLFVLFVSFVAPTGIAFAQTGASCTGNGQGTCNSGFICTVTGEGYNTCVSTGGTAAGSVNQQWAIYYRDLVVWAVNSVLIPILFAVAFIVFLYGIYKYFIQEASSESDKADGRKFAMWGIIGFIIISSVWGLVNIAKDTLVPSSANSNHPAYPRL